MKKRDKIVWIDDNPDRQSTAKDLGANFVNVKGEDLALVLNKVLESPPPQLVIIDHVLDKVGANKHRILLKGSTIAEGLKEKWPACAVVGVTNADNLKGIDIRTEGTYDALFPFQDFKKYFDRIGGIADGFALLAKKRLTQRALVKLLKPPEDEIPRLLDALDDDIKARLQDVSSPSRFYRLVERLLERAGFLYDALWSATFLGVNEAGFAKVADAFELAKYKGVFARPDDTRWWSGALASQLYKLCSPQAGELSWHVGRRLPGIKKEHFSSCYFCKEDYPETVAYLDQASEEQYAMHLKCTEPHPLHKRELYFEDIRVMRGR
jgi:hypothetical protein